ncbi:MAG: pyridoxal phosphate-dependent decarboxylase family protein [Thermoanaerobaculia bacterium]
MAPTLSDTAPPARRSGADRIEQARRALERVFEVALAQIDTEADLPRRGDSSPELLLERLGIAIDPRGAAFDEVVDKLRRILAETPSPASPRFFNQLFGGRDPIAVVAEMLTPLTNTSMYTYKVAGPQVLVEREVLSRMAAKVGFAGGEGAMSPGSSLASLTAMLIARNEAVAGARERGLSGETLTVYTSADGHYSVLKAAGILGLGRGNVRRIETDGRGRMRLAALEAALERDLARGQRPILINATAGTTVAGAFDPIAEIAELAGARGIWLNIDGALGGSVVLSERHRDLLAGAERADSFVWNAHKMMGVPLSCSALLLARHGLLARHLGESADYLYQSEADELNPGRRSLQCGRRNDALKLWAAWQLHGDLGYEKRIDRMFDLAAHAARRVEADPALELLMPPQSINVCFEVSGRSSAAICERLDHEGRLLIGHGEAGGRRAIRLVCVNPDLDESDIDAALDEIKRTAAEL